MSEIPVAVIGGGVVGCAVAREISKSRKGVFLFERNPGITEGENQSFRNSGVIHSGIYYDRETRPLKADLCVEGNRLLYEFCDRYRVPALRTGKIVVAADTGEDDVLDIYLRRARENRVSGVEKIPGRRVRHLEPNVKAVSALLVPSAGIVDPVTLVYRLHALASRNGVHTLTGTEVTGLRPDGAAIRMEIRYRDGKTDRVRAERVINAAGTDAARMARLFNPRSPFEPDPVRGESYRFYGHGRPRLRMSGMNVYPTPTTVETPRGRHFTVGVHLTPTFGRLGDSPDIGSTVIIGPKLVPAGERDPAAGPTVGPEVFVRAVRPFFPGLRKEDLRWHQAGIQARLGGHPDFVVAPDALHAGLIHLLGVDSPGLTAALAIARRVDSLI